MPILVITHPRYLAIQNVRESNPRRAEVGDRISAPNFKSLLKANAWRDFIDVNGKNMQHLNGNKETIRKIDEIETKPYL